MKKWDYRAHDNAADEDMQMASPLLESRQIDGDFTERVMEQIRRTELLPASAETMTDYTGNHGHRRRRLRHMALYGGLAAVLVAVAVTLFLLPVMTVPQQVQTSKSQRLLIVPSEWRDLQLLEAKKAGAVKLPDIEITDQGYTLTLQEVVADPNRMILNLRITDAQGLPAEEMMSMFNIRQLELLNDSGEVIGNLQSINNMGTQLPNDKYRMEYLLLTYYFKDGVPGDTVTVKGNVRELMKDSKKNETLTGDWSFSYAADMRAARSQTVTTALDHYSYTTPQGLEITMDKITHSPAGVKFELNTLVTDELMSRIPENSRLTDLGMVFHFEDAKGNIVGEPLNSKYSGEYKLNWEGQDRQLHWTYQFNELPYLNEPVTFVLDSFSFPVESNDSLTFKPANLHSAPAVFTAQGDILNVNNIKITETQKFPGLAAWLAISGEFSNRFDKDVWTARDQDGKTYEVIRNGSYNDGDRVTFGQLDERTNLIYLIVKGMNVLPKELTLIRTVTDKSFKDMDWSFTLPGAAATTQ